MHNLLARQRQTHRQTHRQTDRQTGRHKAGGWEASTQTDTHAYPNVNLTYFRLTLGFL